MSDVNSNNYQIAGDKQVNGEVCSVIESYLTVGNFTKFNELLDGGYDPLNSKNKDMLSKLLVIAIKRSNHDHDAESKSGAGEAPDKAPGFKAAIEKLILREELLPEAERETRDAQIKKAIKDSGEQDLEFVSYTLKKQKTFETRQEAEEKEVSAYNISHDSALGNGANIFHMLAHQAASCVTDAGAAPFFNQIKKLIKEGRNPAMENANGLTPEALYRDKTIMPWNKDDFSKAVEEASAEARGATLDMGNDSPRSELNDPAGTQHNKSPKGRFCVFE